MQIWGAGSPEVGNGLLKGHMQAERSTGRHLACGAGPVSCTFGDNPEETEPRARAGSVSPIPVLWTETP